MHSVSHGVALYQTVKPSHSTRNTNRNGFLHKSIKNERFNLASWGLGDMGETDQREKGGEVFTHQGAK